MPIAGDWVHRTDADGLWRVTVYDEAVAVVIRAGSALNRPETARPDALRMTATTVAERQLGRNQRAMLNSLREHREWYPGCGWIWSNVSATVRICESLARRGLVASAPTKRAGERRYYPVNPAPAPGR